MAKNKLSYFMHSKEPEIVKYPAPEGYVDENGKRIELEFRVLSEEEAVRILKSLKRRTKPIMIRNLP